MWHYHQLTGKLNDPFGIHIGTGINLNFKTSEIKAVFHKENIPSATLTSMTDLDLW